MAGLQFLGIFISNSSQVVYGQTQPITSAHNNNVLDLTSTSALLYNNLRLTTSNVITMAAASISDNGNNNTTPFLLPLPSSSLTAAGLASNTPPSNKNIVNSHSPSQGHTISQNNIVSSNDNHVDNQHKKHKHGSTGDPINHIISQAKKKFIAGDIPFP
jgi:hypothetical protein